MPSADISGFSPWRMVVQDHLNPGSGTRLFRVGLTPAGANDIVWRAGDIAELELPDGQVRSYSIASMPTEGRLDLMVREVRAADGTLGRGTAWLIHDTCPGDELPVRIRPHEPFRTPACNSPLLLVGAGSGLAGLRPHVIEGFAQKRPVWLIYGERQADRDGAPCRELNAWYRGGTLYRFNLALSRSEAGEGAYVQDVIAMYATDLKSYLGAGGVVMTCGSRPMGAAVEAGLRDVCGHNWMETALGTGRYRQALF